MSNNAQLPRIAVVDDQPEIIALVCAMLKNTHVRVDCYLTGKSILVSDNLEAYDIIILDLSLPDLDGIELMQRLETLKPGASLLIISGHDYSTLDAARTIGHSLGFNVLEALQKPFTRFALLSALNVTNVSHPGNLGCALV